MRLWLVRKRTVARAVVAGGSALLAGSMVAAAMSHADQLADAYGSRRTVAVATHDLTVGETLETDDVRSVELPAALLAGTPTDAPLGRVVVWPVLAGEVLVDDRLAPEGITGPMALAPPETRALAIPTPTARPPVSAGDRVDVVAVSLDGSTRTQRVATGAVVIATTDEAVTVAVEPGELTATARAAIEGTAVIALGGDP